MKQIDIKKSSCLLSIHSFKVKYFCKGCYYIFNKVMDMQWSIITKSHLSYPIGSEIKLSLVDYNIYIRTNGKMIL